MRTVKGVEFEGTVNQAQVSWSDLGWLLVLLGVLGLALPGLHSDAVLPSYLVAPARWAALIFFGAGAVILVVAFLEWSYRTPAFARMVGVGTLLLALTLGHIFGEHAIRETLLDPVLEAVLTPRTVLTRKGSENVSVRHIVLPQKAEWPSPSLHNQNQEKPGLADEDVPILLTTPVWFRVLASRPFRRPVGAVFHDYDVSLFTAAASTALVLGVFVAGAALPWGLFLGCIAYLVVVSLAMLFSDVALGPAHPVFLLGYVFLPSTAFGFYLRRMRYYVQHPVYSLLHAAPAPNANTGTRLKAMWEEYRRGRSSSRVQQLEEHLDSLREAALRAVPSQHTIRPVWRLLFGGLFEPALRPVAERVLLDGEPLTLRDFTEHPELFRNFVENCLDEEDTGAGRSRDRNVVEEIAAPDDSTAAGSDRTTAEGEEVDAMPLTIRTVSGVPPAGPETNDYLAAFAGDPLALTRELVDAELHGYREVRGQPTAWWRRMLKMPSRALSETEQVQDLFGKVEAVLTKATDAVKARNALMREHRQGVIEEKTAELGYRVVVAEKTADMKEHEARAREAEARTKASDRTIADAKTPDQGREEAEKEATHKKVMAEINRDTLVVQGEAERIARAPVPKVGYDESFREDLERTLKRMRTQVWGLSRVEEELRKLLAELEEAGYEPTSDLYQQALNEYEQVKLKIMKKN